MTLHLATLNIAQKILLCAFGAVALGFLSGMLFVFIITKINQWRDKL